MVENRTSRQFSIDTKDLAAIFVESIRLRSISCLLVEKSELLCARRADECYEARSRIPEIDRALKALGWLPPPVA